MGLSVTECLCATATIMRLNCHPVAFHNCAVLLLAPANPHYRRTCSLQTTDPVPLSHTTTSGQWLRLGKGWKPIDILTPSHSHTVLPGLSDFSHIWLKA